MNKKELSNTKLTNQLYNSNKLFSNKYKIEKIQIKLDIVIGNL